VSRVLRPAGLAACAAAAELLCESLGDKAFTAEGLEAKVAEGALLMLLFELRKHRFLIVEIFSPHSISFQLRHSLLLCSNLAKTLRGNLSVLLFLGLECRFF